MHLTYSQIIERINAANTPAELTTCRRAISYTSSQVPDSKEKRRGKNAAYARLDARAAELGFGLLSRNGTYYKSETAHVPALTTAQLVAMAETK